MNFQEVLAGLPPADHIERLELSCDGAPAGHIDNRPGSAGSVRVYAAVARDGRIDRDAARRALELYAEHTAAARARPGLHPNIDRLLRLLADGRPLTVSVIPRSR